MVNPWAIRIIIIILFFVLIAAALAVSPVEVTTFTPDGTHFGDFQIGTTWYNIFQIIFGPNVDIKWVTVSSVIQFLVLPFAAIALIMYGFLSEIVIFRRVPWFGQVMAIIIALIASSLGFTVSLIRGYLAIAGGFGIVAFGFILFLAIAFWFVGRLGEYGVPLGALETAVSKVERRSRIDAALATAQRYANSIRTTDPATAGEIDRLVAEANLYLARTPPELNEAEGVTRKLETLIRW